MSELGSVGVTVSVQTIADLETRNRPHAKMSVDLAVGLARVWGTTVEKLASESACERCKGAPPDGFTCNECGTS